MMLNASAEVSQHSNPKPRAQTRMRPPCARRGGVAGPRPENLGPFLAGICRLEISNSGRLKMSGLGLLKVFRVALGLRFN